MPSGAPWHRVLACDAAWQQVWGEWRYLVWRSGEALIYPCREGSLPANFADAETARRVSRRHHYGRAWVRGRGQNRASEHLVAARNVLYRLWLIQGQLAWHNISCLLDFFGLLELWPPHNQVDDNSIISPSISTQDPSTTPQV